MRRLVIMATAGAIALGACSSAGAGQSTATFYRQRACVDWAHIVDGVAGKTMTATDIAAKLGKMATNAESVALFESQYSSWPDAVKRLRVDLLNDDGEGVKADLSAAKGPC